jgi:WD40 repeat protein
MAEFMTNGLLLGWSESLEFHGNWTPDGKYFLFSANREGKTGIWAIREKQNVLHKTERQPVLLTPGPIYFWFQVPSVDGNRLFATGGQSRGELTRYDLKSRQLVSYLSGISAVELDFSKDGLWVTYVAIPDGTLWRSRLDGSQRMQLTFEPMLAGLPHWSPDGKRIAFAGKVSHQNWKIYIIPFDGGSPEPVTENERTEVDPTWSPDGNSVVFGENFVSDRPTHIYAVDLRTRRLSELPGSNEEDAALRTEASVILAHALRQRQLSNDDKNYLADLVARRTGLNHAEAEQRVSGIFERDQQAADQARKAIAHSLYWLFVALLLGAFSASFAATVGGRRRDHVPMAAL